MSDEELNRWEHRPDIIKVLTSCEMGAWLHRRDENKAKQDQSRMSEWIPVSERLPDKSEYGKVLVTYIPSGGILWTTVIIAHYSDLMGIAKPSFHIGEVGKESFQNITKQVIAWMPLPEPYTASPTGAERSDKE